MITSETIIITANIPINTPATVQGRTQLLSEDALAGVFDSITNNNSNKIILIIIIIIMVHVHVLT